ncbi:SDR family NAD(P)-dependent oxidoreductase [Acuticoccus sp.]|uniref:SDR family NAD(P)-dependent oxidoreductase n=1 Tax=Acuticoccus sp. TaxID=1904378 RepID=UPI003B528996
MARLQGKTALIFGAGSVGDGWGNGRATAAVMLREGARVFGTDRDTAALARTVKMVAEHGRMESAPCDITSTADLDTAIEACRQAFGRIDILVNNVGGSVPGDVVGLPSEAWDAQFDHNINYVFETMKRVVPIMVEQGGGAIVNLASIAALRFFGPDCVAYAAAKAGLIKMGQVTAVKYARQHVRVNTVVPGLMNTPLVTVRLAGQRGGGDADRLIAARHAQVPMGHMGDGWDVAHAVAFLASDEAKYITATELVVDGGLQATCVAPSHVISSDF